MPLSGTHTFMPFPGEPFAAQVDVLPYQRRWADERRELVWRLEHLVPGQRLRLTTSGRHQSQACPRLTASTPHPMGTVPRAVSLEVDADMSRSCRLGLTTPLVASRDASAVHVAHQQARESVPQLGGRVRRR